MHLQIPIPAQRCRACGVVGGRDIRTGDATQHHGGLQASVALGEVAAVDQDVAIRRQCLANDRQLVEVG